MAIMTAAAGRCWGRPLPDGVAYIVNGHPITYAEIGRRKRERQARRLAYRREVRPWRAVRLWVAYFDQSLMGGWHAFVHGIDLDRVWVDRDRKHWREVMMQLFPVTLLPDWDCWKEAFAVTYKAGRHDRRPLGVAYLWHRDGTLSARPTP